MRTRSRCAAVRPRRRSRSGSARARRSGCSTACAASTTARSKPHGDAKSISRDETFPADIDNDDELARELLALVTRAATDLRGDGMTARTVTVRIRDHDFKTRQASRTLDAPVISDRVILEVAHAVAGEAEKGAARSGATGRRGAVVARAPMRRPIS